MAWAIITIYTSKCAQMDPQQLPNRSKVYSRCICWWCHIHQGFDFVRIDTNSSFRENMPEKVSVVLFNSHLFLLRVRPHSNKRLITARKLRSCSDDVRPKMIMSSLILMTPGMPCNTCAMVF